MNNNIAELLSMISELSDKNVNLMEVCGTHTMSIAKSGIRSVLPENIRLLSGPGCPVCVTPEEVIDEILKLSMEKGITIATYGDLIKVPGSERGTSLAGCRAEGADIRVVYSPMDAVKIAGQEPSRQVVFLGAGFETTAPGTAIAVKAAAEERVRNFSIFSMLKMTPPALRTLINDPEFNVQGFICPGHVATIIGEDGFRFLSEEYGIPAVISGFEPEDILLTVSRLMDQISTGKAELLNEYKRAVSKEGNKAAKAVMNQMLEGRDDIWRGLGTISESGLKLRSEFKDFDAEARFGITVKPSGHKSPCRCGEVIQGRILPVECPLFGKACTPDEPMGPCMVSSEGACAAYFKYNV